MLPYSQTRLEKRHAPPPGIMTALVDVPEGGEPAAAHRLDVFAQKACEHYKRLRGNLNDVIFTVKVARSTG